MAKRINIVVESCRECPYRIWGIMVYVCKLTNKKVELGDGIADTCPLKEDMFCKRKISRKSKEVRLCFCGDQGVYIVAPNTYRCEEHKDEK